MAGRDGKMRPEVRCSRYFFVNFVTNSKNNLYLCIGLLCAGPFVYKRRVLLRQRPDARADVFSGSFFQKMLWEKEGSGGKDGPDILERRLLNALFETH